MLLLGCVTASARSKRATDYINQSVEAIKESLLQNAREYQAKKHQIQQLQEKLLHDNSQGLPVEVEKMLSEQTVQTAQSYYIDEYVNTGSLRASGWSQKEIKEIEDYFENEFPLVFGCIEKVSEFISSPYSKVSPKDSIRIQELLTEICTQLPEIEIPGYVDMGVKSNTGESLYWATTNYSKHGKDIFTCPSDIKLSPFTFIVDGEEYNITPRIPSVKEVEALTRISVPSLHTNRGQSSHVISVIEVSDDKIFVTSDENNNTIEFPTGAYWTSSSEWAYEFSVPGLDVSTGDFPIKAQMVNIADYNGRMENQGKPTVTPHVRLILPVDEKLIQSHIRAKRTATQNELYDLLSPYEESMEQESQQNYDNVIQPLMQFFSEIQQQIQNEHPFDYTLTRNVLISRDRNNQVREITGYDFYTLEVTVNSSGQKLSNIISKKFEALKNQLGESFSGKYCYRQSLEAYYKGGNNILKLPKNVIDFAEILQNNSEEIKKLAFDFGISIVKNRGLDSWGNMKWESEDINLATTNNRINSTISKITASLLPNYTVNRNNAVYSISLPSCSENLYVENPFLIPLKKNGVIYEISFTTRSQGDKIRLLIKDKKVKVQYKTRYYREERGYTTFEK